jgi:hypothetical protein
VNGEYAVAIERLRPLVSIEAVGTRGAVLITAARRYYAACLYALRQEAEARATLERMLREDPDARLDQTQYDTRFVRLFELLLREMQPELDRLRTERVLSREQAETRRAAREALMRELLTHATVDDRAPRELMWVPFGVGQIANGQRVVGAVFLVTELVLVASTVATYFAHQAVTPADGTLEGVEEFTQAQTAQALEITNWVSAGLLGAVAIAGIVHANVTWQPERRRIVPRPMPPEFQGVRIMAGAAPDGTGASVGLRLRF